MGTEEKIKRKNAKKNENKLGPGLVEGENRFIFFKEKGGAREDERRLLFFLLPEG